MKPLIKSPEDEGHEKAHEHDEDEPENEKPYVADVKLGACISFQRNYENIYAIHSVCKSMCGGVRDTSSSEDGEEPEPLRVHKPSQPRGLASRPKNSRSWVANDR